MPQTKTLQHLRNSTVYASLSAAQAALQGSTFMSNRSDGEMVLARYNKTENNTTVIKTLVGIYHKSGNNVSCTFLTEVNPDNDHLTVSVNDMAYWNNKLDELVSGEDIKTINGTSLLGSGNISIDANKIIPGEYNTTLDVFYRASILGNQWVTERMPTTYYSDKLYLDISDKKIYWYDEVLNTFSEVGGVSITIDSTITSGGTNPVRGGAIYTALQGKIGYISYQDLSSLDGDTPANGTIGFDEDNANFYIYNGIEGEWFRIDRLVVNSITNGSLNAVTSGAVYTALSNKEDKLTVVTNSSTGAVSQALNPNVFYKFTGNLTSLTLTLVSGAELCIYAGKFTADSSGCQLSLPNTVTIASSVPSIEGGKTYEFSIADNVLLMVEV